MPLFFQLALDVRGDLLRRSRRREAPDDSSLLVYQELGEIPLDGVAEEPTFFALQPLVQRVGAAAVHFDLRKQRKSDAVVQIAERLDFFVGARLLMSELVAGKAKNFEALIVVLRVELLQAFVLR